MKTIKIDSCSFGSIIIDGKTCTDDLIILSDEWYPETSVAGNGGISLPLVIYVQ